MEALLNYGLAGIVLAIFLAWASKEYAARVAERDRAEDRSKALTDDVLTKVAPAIQQATATIQAREAFEDEVLDVLVDVRRLLERGGT